MAPSLQLASSSPMVCKVQDSKQFHIPANIKCADYVTEELNSPCSSVSSTPMKAGQYDGQKVLQACSPWAIKNAYIVNKNKD